MILAVTVVHAPIRFRLPLLAMITSSLAYKSIQLGGILDSPNIAIRRKSGKPLKGKFAAKHQVLDP
jgi:hypothetical protein